MQKLFRLVVAASATAVLALPPGVALAQGAPGAGTAPAPPPAASSPAAPEARTLENKAPEAAPAEDSAPRKRTASKKRKPAKMTRRQEIDRSIDSGTVPARYRNQVPKEYHQYIPFERQ
jgi:hypothetical protein